MVVCKNCGKENQPQYKFCLYCGSEIRAESDAKEPGLSPAAPAAPARSGGTGGNPPAERAGGTGPTPVTPPVPGSSVSAARPAGSPATGQNLKVPAASALTPPVLDNRGAAAVLTIPASKVGTGPTPVTPAAPALRPPGAGPVAPVAPVAPAAPSLRPPGAGPAAPVVPVTPASASGLRPPGAVTPPLAGAPRPAPVGGPASALPVVQAPPAGERRVVPGLPSAASVRAQGPAAPSPRAPASPGGGAAAAAPGVAAPATPATPATAQPGAPTAVVEPSDRFPAGWMRGRLDDRGAGRSIEGEKLRPPELSATPLPQPRPPSPFFTGEMTAAAKGPASGEGAAPTGRARTAAGLEAPLSPAALASAGRAGVGPAMTAPGVSTSREGSGSGPRGTTALGAQPPTPSVTPPGTARPRPLPAPPGRAELTATARPPEVARAPAAPPVIEEVRGEPKTAGIPVARAEPRVCPTCKASVPRGFQFCGQCGGRVEGPEPPRRAVATVGRVVGRLVLIRPDGSEGGYHPLNEGVNILGRGSGPLFDADSYLSPLHLQVEPQETGVFTLRDAGSLNGVFIKLSEEEPVGDGAVFRIGQELLRFDTIRAPRPMEDGTEIMGSPNPGYWGRIAIIIGKGQDGSCFPLFGDAVVLGRERGDILFSEDGYVSGTHARISFRHGQVFLQDLASSNGTFLKIRGERTVRSGTYVLMGQQLFRVMAG